MPSTCVDALRTQKDNHSPSATPVRATLGLVGRAGNVKGGGGGFGGDSARILTVVVEAVGWKRMEGR